MSERKPMPNPDLDFNSELLKLLNETEEHHLSSEMVFHLMFNGEKHFVRLTIEKGEHPLHVGRIPTYNFSEKKTLRDYPAHTDLYNRMRQSKQLEGMEDVKNPRFQYERTGRP